MSDDWTVDLPADNASKPCLSSLSLLTPADSEGSHIIAFLRDRGIVAGSCGTPVGSALLIAARTLHEDGDRTVALRLIRTMATPAPKRPVLATVSRVLLEAATAIEAGEHLR